MTNATTGFIGLGNMGAPMAGHLLDAGVPLIVYDVRAAATTPLVARGARAVASPAAVAEAASTVITIVPSSREVRALIDAMLPSLRPGHLLVEMTTSDPSVTRELAARVAARGAALVDAPVSGGVKGAVERTLAIMIGGEPAGGRGRRRVFPPRDGDAAGVRRSHRGRHPAR